MPTEPITLAALTTVGGIAVATTLVDKLIWTTVGTSLDSGRFGPIVAVITGVVLGIGAALALQIGGSDLAQAAINGAVAGFASAGLYDVVTSKAGLTA